MCKQFGGAGELGDKGRKTWPLGAAAPSLVPQVGWHTLPSWKQGLWDPLGQSEDSARPPPVSALSGHQRESWRKSSSSEPPKSPHPAPASKPEASGGGGQSPSARSTLGGWGSLVLSSRGALTSPEPPCRDHLLPHLQVLPAEGQGGPKEGNGGWLFFFLGGGLPGSSPRGGKQASEPCPYPLASQGLP